jgi:hypothetical protein
VGAPAREMEGRANDRDNRTGSTRGVDNITQRQPFGLVRQTEAHEADSDIGWSSASELEKVARGALSGEGLVDLREDGTRASGYCAVSYGVNAVSKRTCGGRTPTNGQMAPDRAPNGYHSGPPLRAKISIIGIPDGMVS